VKIKAKDIRVGDRRVVPWDEPPKLVTRVYLGRPGRGIKGRGSTSTTMTAPDRY
jgi:hypothetical protein